MAKKPFRLFLRILGITVGTILILIILLPVFFKKQMLNLALNEANKMLYAEISLEDFDLTLIKNFPNPTLRLENLVIKNRVNFDGDTLAIIKQFDACINLWSLFSDTYQLKKLSIDNALINVKYNEDALFNWDIMIPDSLQTEIEDSTTTTEASHFNLKADKISITNSTIHYADVPYNMFADVEDFNFNLKGNLSDVLTTLKFGFDAKKLTFKMDGIPYLTNTAVAINTEIDADLDKFKFTLRDNEIDINTLSLKLEGWVEMPDDDIDMDLSIALKNSNFKNLLSLIPAIYATDFADIQTTGELAFSAYAKGKLTDVLYPAFGVDLKVANAMFKYPDLPAAVNDINIDAKVTNPGGDLDFTVVDVKKFHFEILKNPFDIFTLITTPMSDPNINLTAKGTLNLNDVQKIFPFDEETELNGIFNIDLALKGLMSYLDNEEYEKFEAGGNMNINNLVLKNTDMFDKDILIPEASFTFTPQFAELEKLNLIIDNNDLSINGKVENYIPYIFSSDACLKGDVNISSNYLNVNDLMAMPIANSTEEDISIEDNDEAMTLIEVPEFLDVNANLNIKNLIYDNFDLRNANLAVSIANKRLTIKNLAADLFNGNIKVSGFYECINNKTGNADIDVSVTKISPKELVTTFGMFEKYMPVLNKADGLISLSLKGSTNLDETMDIDYNSANFEGKLGLIDCNVQNVESLKKVANLFKMDSYESFNLKDIAIGFFIKDGNLITNPFNFKVDKTNISVDNGTIGLDKSLNYNALFQIPKVIMGAKANEMLGELTAKAKSFGVAVNESDNAKINLKIGGTIDQPTFDIGLNEMKDQVKDAIKDAVKEKVEEVKEKVKETVNKAIEEAQKKADALVAEAQKQADALVATAQKQADALVKAEKEAGEKAMKEAKAQADKIIAEAKNPIEKKAKEIAAQKIIDEAQVKVNKSNTETKTKADKIVADAKKQGDKLVSDAKTQGDKMIDEAKKKNG